ncbi:MAG: YcxB family protein [Oscillospiraceae bacterium]|nr:YcxB family protein [Oscillospiraceae bacterium]
MEEKDTVLEENMVPEEETDTPEEITEEIPEETVEMPEEKTASKLVTDQGLNADEYAVSDPWVDSEELSDEEEEELSGYEIRYDLKPEEAAAAMKAFQKKVLFRKNLIYTAVLAVLAALYFVNILKNPDYAMGKFLCVFALIVIALLWYLPHRHIQKTAKAIGLTDSTFTIEVSDVGFILKEEGGKYLVRYITPTVGVLELENVFVVCVSKEKMFAIPKRCVPAEDMEELKRQLKEGLGEKYENWIKA